jgi:hypothetical protein
MEIHMPIYQEYRGPFWWEWLKYKTRRIGWKLDKFINRQSVTRLVRAAAFITLVWTLVFIGIRIEMVAKAIQAQTATQYQIQMCMDKAEEAVRGLNTVGLIAKAEFAAAKEQNEATKDMARRLTKPQNLK